MYWFLPLMRGHPSWKVTFLMQKGWPHKRGSTVHTTYQQHNLNPDDQISRCNNLEQNVWCRYISQQKTESFHRLRPDLHHSATCRAFSVGAWFTLEKWLSLWLLLRAWCRLAIHGGKAAASWSMSSCCRWDSGVQGPLMEGR